MNEILKDYLEKDEALDCWIDSKTTYLSLKDIEILLKIQEEQLRLGVVSKSVNCEHPFYYVISKCNGELNKCLKCGKQL